MEKRKKPERQLHILFVLENYYPNIGGVEKLFRTLAEQLSASGHKATIITTRLSGDDPAFEQINNIHIYRYNFFNRYFFTLMALLPVLRHARHADVVHTTSYNAALPAFLGAFILQKKVIVTFHEVWDQLWFHLPFMSWVGKWLHHLFEKMLLRLPFHRFIAVSRSTAEALVEAGVSPLRVQVIYNGLDYSELTPLYGQRPPELPFTWLFFGRLGVSKGLDILVKAAALFRSEAPDSRLVMIIPRKPDFFFRKVLSLIRQEGLEDYVELMHHLTFTQLREQLSRVDCVAIPSLSEGFCFAAAECVALGVPIISSGRAALREVVGGHFVTMPSADAQGLLQALRMARRGEWQYLPPRRFELAETVRNYMDLYHSCLCEKSS